MIWRLATRYDPEGVRLANRHYNRQQVSSPQFVPPGRCIVLRAPHAVWVSSWPQHAQHAWRGAWINTLFRREGGTMRASAMITQALAATRAIWGTPPTLGCITFVDPSKIRHKRDPGRCYLRAGFCRVGTTRKRGYLVFQLLPEDMPAMDPPVGYQLLMRETEEMAL